MMHGRSSRLRTEMRLRRVRGDAPAHDDQLLTQQLAAFQPFGLDGAPHEGNVEAFLRAVHPRIHAYLLWQDEAQIACAEYLRPQAPAVS